MRPLRLARIAAEAEGVRLRGLTARAARRAVLAAIAMIFMIAALAFAHVAAWYELRIGLEQSFLATAGILGGIDLLLAIILSLFAARSVPSRVEREALEVRRRAIEGMTGALSLTQLLVPALRLATRLGRRRRG